MLPKISCYSNTCWFVHEMYDGEHIAKVIYKDAEMEDCCSYNLYYEVVPAEKYDPSRHHYWNFIPEWNMYIRNISAGHINK